MKSFGGKNALGDIANFLLKQSVGGYKAGLVPTLDQIGIKVTAEVKKEIGTYQPGIGPYPATAPLSPVTLDIKTRRGHGKGGNADTPLWATGEFHDDVNYKADVATLSVEVGTNKEHVKYTELGTSQMPPRPVFGPSTLRVLPHLLPMIAQAGAMGVTGGVWKGLGAEATTFTQSGPNAHLSP